MFFTVCGYITICHAAIAYKHKNTKLILFCNFREEMLQLKDSIETEKAFLNGCPYSLGYLGNHKAIAKKKTTKKKKKKKKHISLFSHTCDRN